MQPARFALIDYNVNLSRERPLACRRLLIRIRLLFFLFLFCSVSAFSLCNSIKPNKLTVLHSPVCSPVSLPSSSSSWGPCLGSALIFQLCFLFFLFDSVFLFVAFETLCSIFCACFSQLFFLSFLGFPFSRNRA